MKSLFSRFAKDESGATAIEYALVVGFISLVGIVFFNVAGAWLNSVFNEAGNNLEA
jgi:pilus assembly protein Flp/PilA